MCRPHGVEVEERKEMLENKGKFLERERAERYRERRYRRDEREWPLYYLFYVARIIQVRKRKRDREREKEREIAGRKEKRVKSPGYY